MANDRTKVNQAEIRLRNERVGILVRQDKDSYIFKYDEPYLKKKDPIAIALGFPLSGVEFKSDRLHPFFDNLIMEGWLLNQAEKNYHIDKKNRWALLMLVGANPVGAVSVHALTGEGHIIIDDVESEDRNTKSFPIEIASEPGVCSFCFKLVEQQKYHVSCYKKLWGNSKTLFVKLDKDQPLQSFSKTVHDGSISGAQRKGLFALKKNELYVNSAESSYILKPDGDHPELPANEHLTMTAARQLKFDVPPTGLIKIENVGQAISDYTQAGPLNLNDYFRRVLFCFLTSNGDMHLKNWSLLEMENNPGIYRLSPVYDWLNTRIVLPGEKDDLAIPLLGKKSKMQKTYFQRFAKIELKLNEKQVEGAFSEIPHWTKTLESLIPHSFLSDQKKLIYLDTLKMRSKVLSE